MLLPGKNGIIIIVIIIKNNNSRSEIIQYLDDMEKAHLSLGRTHRSG